MARKLVMVTVLFAALAYLLYDHIPEGYSTSSSIQLRFIQAGVNAGRFLSTSAEALGLVPGYKISRVFCRASRWFTPQPTDEVVRWYETVFDGVPVRVYEPRERRGVLPGFVYYHGGGFTICDLDSHHAIVHQLATLTNTVVISVDYRLAPEHPFPAAHDDCATATKYFINNARKYNVDPKRIAIGGDSAGGNLAATVSLRLRDEHFSPSIKVQVLIYPTVQLIDLMLPSAFQNEYGIVLYRKDMKYFSTIYVSGHSKYADAFANNAHVPLTIRKDLSNTHLSLKKLPTKYTTGFTRPEPQEPDKELWDEIKSTILNPYLCPLIAQNSTGLPLTYIYTGDHDPLRDEGFLYAKKLKEADNKVEHFHHDVGFHGIFQFGLYWPETQLAFKHMVDYILKHL